MLLLKIGGGKAINIPGIISDLAQQKRQAIIVHGANALRDEIAEQLGAPKQTITSASGYSSVFSDEKALDIMMMAYAGLRNKRIVELCQQNCINAVGLSGLDGHLIRARRNRGIRVKKGEKLKMVRDLSGKPFSINSTFLHLLLKNGYTPVISVPILDENNVAVNSENDEIVALLQKEMQPEQVIQFIEAPGLLKNKEDESSLIETLFKHEVELWLENVSGRMKRKILALNKLFLNGAQKVTLSDGRVAAPLSHALLGKGTVIT